MSEPLEPPLRGAVDSRHTFDLDDLFPSRAAWEAALEVLERDLPPLVAYRGRLAESGPTLLAFLEANADYEVLLNRAWLYAHLRSQADTRDEEAQALLARVLDLLGRASADTAWEHAEHLELTPERPAALRLEEPGLGTWERHFRELERRRQATRSAEVEAVLRQVDDLAKSVARHQPTLDAELAFDPVLDERGEPVELTSATRPRLVWSPDREVRRRAHESYDGAYRRHRRTFAAFLETEVKRRVLEARVRGHASTLEAALFEGNIPRVAFDATVETFVAHQPVWHRYWEVKRRALGLDRLRPYDLHLDPEVRPFEVPYDKAVEWMVAAVRPLGDEYADTLGRGLTVERWADVYPTAGKSHREFSLAVDGSKPYLFLWYRDNLAGASTLAHESGHSMHSFYTYGRQPHQYAGYGVVAAEVAANTHQALLRHHLLESQPDRNVRLAVLLEELDTYARYLLRMPVRARFEADIHAAVERGEALSADRLTARYAELNAEAHGPAVLFEEADGIAWADAIVLYQNFASFQYALGLVGGQTIADRVLGGEPGAAQGYLAFLSAGKSLDQLESLKLAGVDFTTPEPLERAFRTLEDRVARLEQLLETPDSPPEPSSEPAVGSA